jgi:glycosyltransferase involved in cell wall biosynthesis
MPEIKRKTEIVYNPPPPLPAISKRISEEPLLIYAGGESYTKGFGTLLKAVTRVLARHRAKAYILLGKEASQEDKTRMTKLSGRVNGRLILLDKLPHNEYLKLHEHAWALLFPSITEEPLPYAVVEAMLAGSIPIASKVGGVPEIVMGSPVEEHLFSPGDTNEFIDRIEKLLSQSKRDIMDIGVKLREHVLGLLNGERIESKLTSLFEYSAS